MLDSRCRIAIRLALRPQQILEILAFRYGDRLVAYLHCHPAFAIVSS